MNHLGTAIQENQFGDEYKNQWAEALTVPGSKDLVSSALQELSTYFPDLNPNEIARLFWHGGKLLADHWKKLQVDPKCEKDLISFYNGTDIEIFELMHYHSEELDNGPLNYVYSMELAKRFGCQSYMDYGSGVGSGGIIFARNSFKVTLCDVSTPLLNFAKQRFSKRSLQAHFIDLKNSEPLEKVDFITCFEVLEHLKDPLKTLRKIHGYLHDGGFLVVTAPFSVDEKRPMHIVHNSRLIDRFRGQGFHMRWDIKNELRGKIHEPFFVMQKAERSKLKNLFYEAFDYYIPESMKNVAYRVVKGKRKNENFVHNA